MALREVSRLPRPKGHYAESHRDTLQSRASSLRCRTGLLDFSSDYCRSTGDQQRCRTLGAGLAYFIRFVVQDSKTSWRGEVRAYPSHDCPGCGPPDDRARSLDLARRKAPLAANPGSRRARNGDSPGNPGWAHRLVLSASEGLIGTCGTGANILLHNCGDGDVHRQTLGRRAAASGIRSTAPHSLHFDAAFDFRAVRSINFGSNVSPSWPELVPSCRPCGRSLVRTGVDCCSRPVRLLSH